LKKFQLSRPDLGYDVILFDEGQDASPVMLDIFMFQKAKKIIVGDVYQQIYGWRHAINALKQVDFTIMPHGQASVLTCTSPTCHGVPAMEETSREDACVRIKGSAPILKSSARATIARTNLALLKCAIDAVQHDRSMKKIYFEGNFNSYTYAAAGASIYDVLNLYLDKKDNVRDPLIRTMERFFPSLKNMPKPPKTWNCACSSTSWTSTAREFQRSCIKYRRVMSMMTSGTGPT